jgi:hypothetical protein
MNLRNRVNNKLANYNFFQVDNFEMEYYDDIKKEKKTNKPIGLNPINWNEYKETFYNQRINNYKNEGFTKNQIINFEITETKRLPSENKKYIALKDNYTQLLNEKLKSEQGNPEQTKKQIEFEDFFFDVTPKQLKQIKENFINYKGKKLAIFISLAVNEFDVLKIESNDKSGFSCSNFVRMFKENNNYTSVNNFLDANYKFKGNNKDLEQIKKQLQSILNKN